MFMLPKNKIYLELITCRFNRLPTAQRDEVLKIFVEGVTELVRMPMAGRYLKHKNGEGSEDSHLVIVCSVGKHVLKEDSRSDSFQNTNALSHQSHSNQGAGNTYKGHHDGGGFSDDKQDKTEGFTFTEDQWKSIPEVFGFQPDVSEGSTALKKRAEHFIQDVLHTNASLLDNPNYDFNRDVYAKMEAYLAKQHNADISSDLKEQFDRCIKTYEPTMKSFIAFLQKNTLEDYILYELVESPAEVDDGQGGPYTVQTRKARPRHQKYSAECNHGFRCRDGFKWYVHTLSSANCQQQIDLKV